MNNYYVVIGITLCLVVFWKFSKPSFKKIINNQEISTFSKADINAYKEKQYKNIYIASLLLIFWPLCNYSLIYIISSIFIMIMAYFIPIMKLKEEEKKEISKLKYDFPIWLRQLQILLQNNNVLHALEQSEINAPVIMREDLHSLIMQIRMNATSSEPYYNFMKGYGIYEINRAMKLLYRYHMMGADDSYYQFQRMLEATRKWLRQEREDARKNTISMMNWVGIVPLLGATIMFMVLMAMVLEELLKGGMML